MVGSVRAALFSSSVRATTPHWMVSPGDRERDSQAPRPSDPLRRVAATLTEPVSHHRGRCPQPRLPCIDTYAFATTSISRTPRSSCSSATKRGRCTASCHSDPRVRSSEWWSLVPAVAPVVSVHDDPCLTPCGAARVSGSARDAWVRRAPAAGLFSVFMGRGTEDPRGDHGAFTGVNKNRGPRHICVMPPDRG